MAKKKGVKAIKKHWVKIIAPKLFKEQALGESYVPNADVLVGRCVSVSMMTLTGDPQKQSVNVKFKIISVVNDVAQTEFRSFKIQPAAAKKLVRRKRSKLEDSFIVETADKKIIRIKPLSVTRGKGNGMVLASLRKFQRAYLAKIVSQTKLEDLVQGIVRKRIQSQLSKVLRKFYPIVTSEIRQLEYFPADKVKDMKLKIILPPEKLPDFAEEIAKKESAPKPVKAA